MGRADAAIEGTDASLGDAAWAGRASGASGGPRGGRGDPASVVRLPALAATLRALADDGFDAYYDGDLGERIARGLAAAGGSHTVEDLRSAKLEWTTPISTTYRGPA